MTSTRSQPVRVAQAILGQRRAPAPIGTGRASSRPQAGSRPRSSPAPPHLLVAALRSGHRGLHGRRRLPPRHPRRAARRRSRRHLAPHTPAPGRARLRPTRLPVGRRSPGRGPARAPGAGGPGRPRRTDHVRRRARRSRRGGRRPWCPAHQLRAGDRLGRGGRPGGRGPTDRQSPGRPLALLPAGLPPLGPAPRPGLPQPPPARRWRAGPVAPPAGSSPGRRWSATGVVGRGRPGPRGRPGSRGRRSPGRAVRRPGRGRRER